MLLIGSHVGMSGKKMFLGSVEEALSYNANTFMVYTGAPQNTRRKELSELKIPEAKALMKENGIEQFIVHAPYIINLANSVNPSTYELAVEFLEKEIARRAAMFWFYIPVPMWGKALKPVSGRSRKDSIRS